MSALCLTILIIVIITITVRLIINYLSIHLSNIQSNKRWNDGTLPISISVSISIDDQTARRPGVNEERPFLFLINSSRMLRYSLKLISVGFNCFPSMFPCVQRNPYFNFGNSRIFSPITPRHHGGRALPRAIRHRHRMPSSGVLMSVWFVRLERWTAHAVWMKLQTKSGANE